MFAIGATREVCFVAQPGTRLRVHVQLTNISRSHVVHLPNNVPNVVYVISVITRDNPGHVSGKRLELIRSRRPHQSLRCRDQARQEYPFRQR